MNERADAASQTDPPNVPAEILVMGIISLNLIDKLNKNIKDAEREICQLLLSRISSSSGGSSDSLTCDVITLEKPEKSPPPSENSVEGVVPAVPTFLPPPPEVKEDPAVVINTRRTPVKRREKRPCSERINVSMSKKIAVDEVSTTTTNQKKEGSNEHQCDKCQAEFSSITRLNKHLSMVHPSAPKVMETTNKDYNKVALHQCLFCNLTFTNSNTLREHQLRAHQRSVTKGQDAVFCNICGKSCNSRTEYLEHRKRHTVCKEFRCKVCFKGFTNKENLMHHLNGIHNIRQK